MYMKFSEGQSKFLRVFNFAILGYSRNSRKLDAHEKLVFYSMSNKEVVGRLAYQTHTIVTWDIQLTP